MATPATLRSQEYLYQPNSKHTRSRLHRSTVKFRSHGRDHCRSQYLKEASGTAKNNLVMGQVKILKRDEELPLLSRANAPCRKSDRDIKAAKAESKLRSRKELIVDSTRPIGPDPEIVQKEIKGLDLPTVFVNSPPPSSLPVPAFLRGKRIEVEK